MTKSIKNWLHHKIKYLDYFYNFAGWYLCFKVTKKYYKRHYE